MARRRTGVSRLIFEIGLGSVQRPSDWSDFDGRNLRLRQGKTDKPLVLPLSAELRAALLDAQPPKATGPVLRGADGARLTYLRYGCDDAHRAQAAGPDGS